MKLSVLICSIPKRLDKLSNLLEDLRMQRKNKPVEVLYLGDFQNMTVGEKRNWLMRISCGEYLCFIDDDDHISNDYIGVVLKAIDENQGIDCISIGGWQTVNEDDRTRAEFSFRREWGKNFNFRETDKNENYGKMVHARLPNHLCIWKRDIALRVKFPGKNKGEDHKWAEDQMLLGYDYIELKDKLYHYDFNRELTETR